VEGRKKGGGERHLECMGLLFGTWRGDESHETGSFTSGKVLEKLHVKKMRNTGIGGSRTDSRRGGRGQGGWAGFKGKHDTRYGSVTNGLIGKRKPVMRRHKQEPRGYKGDGIIQGLLGGVIERVKAANQTGRDKKAYPKQGVENEEKEGEVMVFRSGGNGAMGGARASFKTKIRRVSRKSEWEREREGNFRHLGNPTRQPKREVDKTERRAYCGANVLAVSLRAK